MPFNSEAATLLPRFYVVVKTFADDLQNKTVKLPAFKDDVAKMADEIRYYQLIDIRDLVASLETDAINVMLKDVVNSKTLKLPFNQTAIWTATNKVAFLKRVINPENDKEYIIISLGRYSDTPVGLPVVPVAATVQMDNPKEYYINPNLEKMFDNEAYEDIRRDTIGTYAIACCLSFLIEHKKIEITDVAVPIQRNTKRKKRGQLPYSEYKQVAFTQSIKPHGEHQGGTHASPRFHVRAGHWRHLSKDRKTWVRAALVGDPSRGSIIKTYKLDTPVNA